MHLKRHSSPKSWPISRKGTTYVVKPLANQGQSMPVLVVLRDILNVAGNKKEVKQAIQLKQILLNNKIITDEKNPMALFDTLTIAPLKKHYRLSIAEGGKFALEEIKEQEANEKVAKIVDKRILKGKKTQLNLSDGRNFLSEMSCDTSDSVVINFKSKKVETCLPFKEGAKVFIFAGKHAGSKGTMRKVQKESGSAQVELKGKDVNVLTKQIMAIK